MKKALSVLLILCLACGFIRAAAEELTRGSFTYAILEDGTAQITGYTGSSTELAIPAELDAYAVTGIGGEAFSDCSGLTEVTIPDSVTSIGDWAFSDCSGLTEVTIPDSVTSVGANPFPSCEQLTDIRISPDHPTLAVIDGVLFSKPDKRLISYPWAFANEAYSIPQGIVLIGNEAFYYCAVLTKVTIPDSVTTIGDYAFFWCARLTEVTIPEGVTGIGDYAFYGCSALTEVTIPDSVTAIGEEAFSGCTALKTVTVGRTSYARQYCIDNDLPYTYPDALDWLNN